MYIFLSFYNSEWRTEIAKTWYGNPHKREENVRLSFSGPFMTLAMIISKEVS